MGWEKRGKRRYYYRKQRVGGRVRSIYLGRDEAAETADVLQQGKEQRRQEMSPTAERAAAIDEELERLADEVNTAVAAAYLLKGYHRHKREWRRRR